LCIEFRQFLPLRRNQTSPTITIPRKEIWNRAKSKQNVWWRGEGGTEQQKRRLCRDGIHIGAYDYISNYHTRGVCDIELIHEFFIK